MRTPETFLSNHRSASVFLSFVQGFNGQEKAVRGLEQVLMKVFFPGDEASASRFLLVLSAL